MGRTPSQYAARAAGFSGLLWLTAAGGLVGLCMRSGLSEAAGAAAVLGAGPVLAMLGFFPLLLLVRFSRPISSCLGGAVWGSGVALLSAGIDPAMWLAYIAGSAVFALLASLLIRRIGFSVLVIAVLWMLTELAMTTSGLAPRGLLASLAEGSALFGGLAAWLGSLHVALLLALVTAGVVAAAAAVIRAARRRWSIDSSVLRPVNRADVQVILQTECGTIVLPRAPPVRRRCCAITAPS